MVDLHIWLAEENSSYLDFLRIVEIWATPRLQQGIHSGYTDHTIQHSKRIVEYLGALNDSLPSDNRLCAPEVCVLIAAAYVHDIGMQDQRTTGLDDIRSTHHTLSGDLMRELAEHSANSPLLSIPEPFPVIFEMIGQVAEGHRKIDLNDKSYDDVEIGGNKIRLRLLSALLRLADELDMDYRRAPMEMIDLQNYPPETLIHWFKSNYISSIQVSNNQITIHYQFPLNKEKDYLRIFDHLVGDKIKYALVELQQIFRDYGLYIQIAYPKYREWSGIGDLPEDVLALAISEATELAQSDRDYLRTKEDINFLSQYSTSNTGS